MAIAASATAIAQATVGMQAITYRIWNFFFTCGEMDCL